MLRRNLSCFLFLLFACVPLLPAMEPQLVVTPRARLLAVTPSNRPFLGAANAQQPVPLAALGYAESELLVSGYGNVYEWSGAAAAAEVTARASDVPWATRVLVRRPVDPAKASGMVVVELLDPASGYDMAPLWGYSWEHFTRRGDVWVGVTVQPAAAEALRKFDPVRYGALSFAFRQAPGCADAPNAESGLAFDMIAQVGALLRSSSKENPLLDLNPWKLVVAGQSLTGGYVTTYANALHRVLRRGDGAPIYDGYLTASGAHLAVPLNQCAAPLAEDDPRRAALPRDVPFVSVTTEADFNSAPALRRADSDATGDLFRLYEIPGSGQLGPMAAGMPADADVKRAGAAPLATDLCVEPRGDYPLGLAFDAIWQQYADWLTVGTPLAQVPRIETAADGTPVRDAQGNARGGWRLPQLDVPVARYFASSTPKDGSGPARACAQYGAKQPFDAARLKALYRNRAAWQQGFRAAVEQAVQERRLTAADGEALKTRPLSPLPAF
jgi:hypothetical protein